MKPQSDKLEQPFWHGPIYALSAFLLLIAALLIAYMVFIASPWDWGNKQKLERKGKQVAIFSESQTKVEAIVEYAETLHLNCHHSESRVTCDETKKVPGSLMSIYILVIEAETKNGEIISPMTYEIAVD